MRGIEQLILDAVNIILKAFDGEYCKEILERGLRDVAVGTCIAIMNDLRQKPGIPTEKFLWIDAEDQRMGRYPGVHWPDLIPLDEETIESMRPCEAVFLTMVERYAKKRELSYAERKRQYFAHLRYWNHVLQTERIDLLLMNTLPHQCYDWVLYHLCKLRKIPVLYIERCYIVDAFYLEEDYEEAGSQIRDRLRELEREYADPGKPVPLSEEYEACFRTLTQENADPWYMFRRSERMQRRSFLHKWAGEAVRLLWRKPGTLLSAVASPEVWARRMRHHSVSLLWDELAKTPDLTQPYIYVPLHLQPEATTCPMSGVFTDQERMVQLLTAHLPPGIRLYVKEHPAQDEVCRSEEFYRSLAEIPAVTLVPREVDTFQLTDHALAVATGTGTAGFEALFRGKPALMFGHRFYQYAPGIHRIRTHEDCDRAIDAIVRRGERPTAREARLFLKAIEDTGTPYVNSKREKDPSILERKAQRMGETIAERLRHFAR